MSININQTLRLSIAAFCAIVIHALIAVILTLSDFSLLNEKEKTIPFKLVSADKSTQIANSNTLSAEENAKAASEYLATLNKSTFDTNSSSSTNRGHSKNPGQGQQHSQVEQKSLTLPLALRGNSSHTAINGLQNIFSRQQQLSTNKDKEQVSSKQAESLSDYEIKLLNALAKDSLYDPFHKIMEQSKQERISLTISLRLLPNGAIKGASIKQTSGIKEIDQLAIQAAYRASPYPTPPRDDIQIGYRYNIPIIYQAAQNKN